MSSLGDLLMSHMRANKNEKVSESDSCDDNKTVKFNETNQETSRLLNLSSSSSPPPSPPPLPPPPISFDDTVDETDLTNTAASKVFSKHTERNVAEDTLSNASSTDDYVRELLDPDDRPRNVWHVVEGPKVQSESTQEANSSSNQPSQELFLDKTSPQSKVFQPADSNFHAFINDDSTTLAEVEEAQTKDEGHRADALSDEGDSQRGRKSSSRDKRRSSSSKRRHSRERSSSDGRHRRLGDDRDKHRSRRRRYDLSDDEVQDDRRHTSHRDDRKRSHSRSSRTSSRRRERSRSNSPSPLTKRNSRTILIMQLSPRVDSRDLEDFFRNIGRVREVRLIMDSKTRRHKGIAYIEFEDSSSAMKAFSLNGKKLYGVPVVIQSADQIDRNKPSADWQSSTSQTINHASSHSSSRSHLPPNCYRVYVGGLNVNLTEDMIRSVFEPFGPIVRLELMKDRVTNVSRGYAFITYANVEDGQAAVQALDGFELGGKSLRVSKSTEKSERQGMDTGITSSTMIEHFEDVNDHYSNQSLKFKNFK